MISMTSLKSLIAMSLTTLFQSITLATAPREHLNTDKGGISLIQIFELKISR